MHFLQSNVRLLSIVCKVIVTYGFDSPEVYAALFEQATGWRGDKYALVQRQVELAKKV